MIAGVFGLGLLIARPATAQDVQSDRIAVAFGGSRVDPDDAKESARQSAARPMPVLSEEAWENMVSALRYSATPLACVPADVDTVRKRALARIASEPALARREPALCREYLQSLRVTDIPSRIGGEPLHDVNGVRQLYANIYAPRGLAMRLSQSKSAARDNSRLRGDVEDLQAKMDDAVEHFQQVACAYRRAATSLEACYAASSEVIAAEQSTRHEAERRAQAEEAAAQAARDREHASEVEQRRNVVKWMRPVTSAELCWYQEKRKSASSEIAAEQHYARVGGGIVDKAKLYALQQTMRGADLAAAAERKELRRLNATPMACTDKTVATLMKCLPVAEEVDVVGTGRMTQAETANPDADESCNDPQIAAYVELGSPLGW